MPEVHHRAVNTNGITINAMGNTARDYFTQEVNNGNEHNKSKNTKSQVNGKSKTDGMNVYLRLTLAMIACVAYMGVSSWLIVLNRQLMQKHGFKYPITLSSLGVIFSVCAAFTATRILRISAITQQVAVQTYVQSMLPVGFFHAATLYLGNAVYLHLSMAFIQMMKATCPIFVMLSLFVFRLESPTPALIASVFIIAFGAALSSYGEINFNAYGLFIQITSEVAEGLRLALTQFCLVGLKFEPMEGLVYLGSASALWLTLGAFILEGSSLLNSGDLSIIAQNPFLFAQAAMLGFGVNLLSLVVIKLTSSLTLKILATAKNTIVVFFGIIFLSELVTGIQGVGYTVSLIGLTYYNYLKLPQKSTNAKKQARI